MPYVDQVTAAFAVARNQPAHAAQQPSLPSRAARCWRKPLTSRGAREVSSWHGVPSDGTEARRYFDSVLAVAGSVVHR